MNKAEADTDRKWISTVIGTAVILCLAVTAYWQLRKLEEGKAYSQFYQEVNQHIQSLENEAQRILATLKHWQSLYSSIGNIAAADFQRVASDVLASHSALGVVAWSPIVPHNKRAEIEKQLGRPFMGFPNVILEDDRDLKEFVKLFNIDSAELAPERDFYLPILIAEPQELTNQLLGLDYLTLRKMGFRLNFQKIVQAGQVTALPIFPSLFSEDNEPILNVVVPIIDLKNSEKYLNPAMLLRGVINVVIPVEKIFNSSDFKNLKGISQVSIGDVTDESMGVGLQNIYNIDAENLLFSERALERQFSMLGRDFTILAQPTPLYLTQHMSLLPYIALSTGILLALFYFVFSLFYRRRTTAINRIVEKRTQRLKNDNQQLNEVNQQLEQLSKIDSLTGIENRRAFDEISRKEWSRARREQRSLVVLMIDVDHFKNYNDAYGHLRGDECLQQVAQCIKNVCCRSSDVVARYGGEEFAVILPSSGPDAMRVAERCRAAVAALKIEHRQSDTSDRVTVSVGMSSVIPSATSSLESLIDSADRALYLAKVQGRNRVIYHTCLSHDAPATTISVGRDRDITEPQRLTPQGSEEESV